jgi:plastocyanin
VRRILVALLVAALGASAGAAVPAAASAAKPRYCKKKPSKLTKKQRRRCKRAKRHSTHSSTTTPPTGPLTNPPAVPPVTDPPVVDPPAPSDPAAGTLGRLSVRAREYSFTLSRTELTAGDSLIELQNAGEDPHDLRIVPSGGGSLLAAYGETAPGTVAKQRVTLPAGKYVLYCGIGDHSLIGMRATLTVSPSAP